MIANKEPEFFTQPNGMYLFSNETGVFRFQADTLRWAEQRKLNWEKEGLTVEILGNGPYMVEAKSTKKGD